MELERLIDDRLPLVELRELLIEVEEELSRSVSLLNIGAGEDRCFFCPIAIETPSPRLTLFAEQG